jgi:hypothetical protein
MGLGSYDHTHDYPERDRQGSKPVGPAGKRQTRRIENPRRNRFLIRGYRNRCSPVSDCATKPNLERCQNVAR